ncbi:MAG: tetratricopeptide repeat protein [Candidatus Manganitrophus sp.]|nr:MAG: tetratricopeptide repeat protein [Candidatus Manganitrophus sp.]
MIKKHYNTIFTSVFLLFLAGCFSKPIPIDNKNHLFKSDEAGILITFPPQWHLSAPENTLFVGKLKPNGTEIARLTGIFLPDIPSLEDYRKIEAALPLPQRLQKFIRNELSHFQEISSREIERKGETWRELVWMGQREGLPKIFHSYTVSIGLNLVQLHFELPAPFYENQQQMIDDVLDGVTPLPGQTPSDEQYAQAYRGVGDLYRVKELWSDAIKSYREALSKKPRDPNLHVLLGESYLKNEEADLALESFQAAIRLTSQSARAYEGLADVYFKKGSTDEGISAIKRALVLSPENIGLYVKLGEAYLKQGRTQESINTFHRLLRRKADSADGHLGLGRAYLAVDLYEQAVLELEQTLKLNPQLNEPHCLLAKAFTHLESTADAEREKKRCAETPAAS